MTEPGGPPAGDPCFKVMYQYSGRNLGCDLSPHYHFYSLHELTLISQLQRKPFNVSSAICCDVDREGSNVLG
jgi:hypothetical protein